MRIITFATNAALVLTNGSTTHAHKQCEHITSRESDVANMRGESFLFQGIDPAGVCDRRMP